jgi:hypothetical protein
MPLVFLEQLDSFLKFVCNWGFKNFEMFVK